MLQINKISSQIKTSKMRKRRTFMNIESSLIASKYYSLLNVFKIKKKCN